MWRGQGGIGVIIQVAKLARSGTEQVGLYRLVYGHVYGHAYGMRVRS